MKNKNRIISLLLSLSLMLSVFAFGFSPIVSHASEEEILISTPDELISLVKKCSYDAWSIGKTVVLTKDISLEGIDFEPIPSFSGTFDGAGHKITGINVTGAYAPAGLISSLEAGGVVKNLTLSATLTPDGDKGYVGGIAGVNNGRIENCKFEGTVIGKADIGGIAGVNGISGSITDCTVSGEIVGELRVGGIAGSNEGLISRCLNGSKVNTVSITPSLSLSDINLSLTLDITKLPSLNTTSTSDIGGIAGYSTGIIMSSVNSGRVGYPHIGYNVGGIVGRNNGHLNGNVNGGEINGRKDVGGIVGQLEPYVSYTLSEDMLAALKSELDAMEQTIASITGSAGATVPGVSTRIDTILENLDNATVALNILMNDATDLGNGVVGEINRTGEILDEVISQLYGITSDIPELSDMLESSLRSLELALGDLEKIAEIGAGAIEDIKNASDDASTALGSIGDAIYDIEAGLTLLENAIIVEDKAAAEEAVGKILDGLSLLVNATDSFAKSLKTVSDILSDAAWVDEAINHLDTVVEIFGKMSDAISTFYDATTEIKENIDINWDKMVEAADQLSESISYLAAATRELAGAMAVMEEGLTEIGEGLTIISESITVNDPDALAEGVEKISDGMEKMISAASKSSAALAKLAEIMEEIEQNGNLTDVFGEAAGAMGDLAEAGADMSEAMLIAWEGLTVLLENIEIDFDMAEEGGALVIGGLDKVTEALGGMQTAFELLSGSLTALDNAITALKAGVNVKDEEKVKAALDSAYDALGDMVDAMDEFAAILGGLTDTLKDAKLWGDDLIDAIGVSIEKLGDMTDALVIIQDGVDKLRDNVSFDLDAASEGLKTIKEGLGKMGDAAISMKDCFAHLSDALKKIDESAVYLPSAIQNLRNSISAMADAIDLIGSMSEKIHALVGYLDGVDPIQLPTISQDTIETANQLFVYISAIENELKGLNTEITGLSSEMIECVGRLNEIFNNISDNIVNTIYDLENGKAIDDVTVEKDVETMTNGKLFGCENNGDVYGDINVGGISGAMGIEYTLDPEDDYTSELSLTQRRQYTMKAAIHACVNNGDVVSKYDCAGGIVGKIDMGLVYGCEAYCAVDSQSGNYVGGIAGLTYGLISNCFAKSSLSGGKYVGGVVGSGVTDASSGESSEVRNCYTMVYINRYTQYAGAISGYNAGSFSENMFVSDDLAGIDRVSYAGKAEPISYDDLIKRRVLPTGFYGFTLEFVIDGEVVYSEIFQYGSSFDSSVFPEIPNKEGHYGRWDRTDLTNLTFDTKVSVVYTPYVTTINSEEIRENGKNIFFVIGEFTAEDKLTIARGCDTTSLDLEENALTKDRLTESWTLTIPHDSIEQNNVHFISESKNCKIFVKVDGVWEEVETKAFGSYITFNVSGETVEIAVVESELNVSIEIIILIALIILQAVVIICILVDKKKKKKKA